MDLPNNGDSQTQETPDLEIVVGAEDSEPGYEHASHGSNGNGNGAPEQDNLPDLLEQHELKGILEAMLHLSQEPLSIERLSALLTEVPKQEIEAAVGMLREDMSQPGRGVQLVEVAGGLRIVTRPDCAPWVKRLEKVKPAPKLSRSALETLAIVAYKQPVVRGEIEQIRGVETSGVLRTLLERRLVRMVGRKDLPGRPIMYGTTKHFLEHFGLRDLAELPPLAEFKELGEPEQATLPDSDDPLVIEQAGEEPSDHPGHPGAEGLSLPEDTDSPIECKMES